MFRFIKKIFLTVLSCVNPLSIMNDQECKVKPEIINDNSDELVFILLVLKQVNEVVIVTISMIHFQKCVFLML